MGSMPKKTLRGVRIFDPRYGKWRKPGNNNPALIIYDLIRRFKITKDTKELRNRIKELANYFEEEIIVADVIITQKEGKPNDCSGSRTGKEKIRNRNL